MYTYADKLESMRSCEIYWAERIVSQLRYGAEISALNENKYNSIINQAVDRLYKKFIDDGAITQATSQEIEKLILPLSVAAKEYQVICAAHAHIDMNWMWGYAETAAVVLDTFQTMLYLMEEYKDFKFSQPQASVYKIVEDYHPEMLEEIKKRVKEGRWEVVASTWVEADKNMPNGESLSRHILYTKAYLSKLLDIDPDSLQIDMEPDTFGHSLNVPEILNNGGVKYYYHCRGYEGQDAYTWKSPSGSSVLAYREPVGYGSGIDGNAFVMTPSFVSKIGMKTMLKVYGVGDHGGGPTRRDLERIIDMSSWPVFPTIRFGTFLEYFKLLESYQDKLPVVEQELNFAFSGCYTTQTRIKLANRFSEARLYSAEAFSTLAANYVSKIYPSKMYEKAWKKTLFNQFHDIITGSGVIETREFAMGEFQKTIAAANTGYIHALRDIAGCIDTSVLDILEDEQHKVSTSEGAGSGFGVSDYGLPQSERGRGKNRVFHFFNPSPYERNEITEITVWDWPGMLDRIHIEDTDGNTISFQIVSGKAQQLHPAGAFWGHKYIKLLVLVKVPALGYNTCILSESSLEKYPIDVHDWKRTETPDSYIMENECIKVVFDSKNASVLSLYDKESKKDYVDPKRLACMFRLIEEDTEKGMTSWIVGRHMNCSDLTQSVKITEACCGNDKLRQWIKYSVNFRSSVLDVTVSLDKGCTALEFCAECDWHELPQRNVSIPQLNFSMPLSYHCNEYLYDIPFGTICRKPMEMDVPANSWAVAIGQDKSQKVIKITSDNKYGFRGNGDNLNLTLIRSSYDPDPYPETGIIPFRIWVELEKIGSNKKLINKAFDRNHPIGFVSGYKHKGTLSLSDSLLSLETEGAAISTVKMPEDCEENAMVVRLYETEGKDTPIKLQFAKEVDTAWFIDINENRISSPKALVNGDIVTATICANTVQGVYIKCKNEA